MFLMLMATSSALIDVRRMEANAIADRPVGDLGWQQCGVLVGEEEEVALDLLQGRRDWTRLNPSDRQDSSWEGGVEGELGRDEDPAEEADKEGPAEDM